jgi:hypothetical protein
MSVQPCLQKCHWYKIWASFEFEFGSGFLKASQMVIFKYIVICISQKKDVIVLTMETGLILEKSLTVGCL